MSIYSSRNSTSVGSECEDEARHCNSSKIIKQLKTLFCCVKLESHDEIIKYNPDEYDYIVEKLVVKRVPFALFAIRGDLLDRHRSGVTMTPEQVSQSASSSTFYKRSNPAIVQEITSMKTATDSGVYIYISTQLYLQFKHWLHLAKN